jgi:hypothetical protein
MISGLGMISRTGFALFDSAGKYFFKEVKEENPSGEAPGTKFCEQFQSTKFIFFHFACMLKVITASTG